MSHPAATVISHMTRSHHRNLIQNNLTSRSGLCNGFDVCFVTLQFDLAPERHDSFTGIVTNGNTFEISFVERFADIR